MAAEVTVNLNRFSGFADDYDRYRPQPPVIFTDILTQLAGGGMPDLVVDLGSGTGLSTRVWAGRAREVVGVEPNPDMRRAAKAHPVSGTTVIRYLDGHSAATGLADGCADIVCCSQSFHWMEPTATLAEVARILRPGGVFAVIDCDWPPTLHCEAELAYKAFMAQIKENERGKAAHQWPKDGHLAQLAASGRFRYTRETAVHHVTAGNADDLVGLALSFGSVQDLLKQGLSEDEIGLTDFRREAARWLGVEPIPWYFTYRMRLGIK